MATPNYLGTYTGLTGIPSLLISSLQQISDPAVYKALYQIQCWANSFMPPVCPAAADGVAAGESTASTSYTNLHTVGPIVTMTTGQYALVILTTAMSNDTTGDFACMSFAVSGATTIAAADASSLNFSNAAGNDSLSCSAVFPVGLTPGSNTFTAKYKSEIGGTSLFTNRWLTVIPTPNAP